MNKYQKQDYIEIDLISMLQKIWDKRRIILLITILSTIVVFLLSYFVIEEKYSSTTKIYVVNQNDHEELTTQDIQLGNYLVQDYKEIILSRDILEGVIDELRLKVTTSELIDNIEVSIPNGTRIINITVQDENAKNAKMIADTLRELSAEKIKKVTRIYDVTVLEEAQISEEPSYPNVKKNTFFGFVITLFLLIFMTILINIFRDRVTYPEDVENKLGLPLLGVIPIAKGKRK